MASVGSGRMVGGYDDGDMGIASVGGGDGVAYKNLWSLNNKHDKQTA